MSKFDRYKRKVCLPIKDERPKGLRSVPVIGYMLMQSYEQQLMTVDDIIAEVVKELREEKDDSVVGDEE